MKNLLTNGWQKLKIESPYSKIMTSAIDDTKKKAISALYHASKKSKRWSMWTHPSLKWEINGVFYKNSWDYIQAAKKVLGNENIHAIIQKESRKAVKLLNKNFEDRVIFEVKELDLGYLVVIHDERELFINKKYWVIPNIWDKIRIYSEENFLAPTRWIDINWEEVFYMTEIEEERQARKENKNSVKKRKIQSKKDKRIWM
jgi:hypothetical protein